MHSTLKFWLVCLTPIAHGGIGFSSPQSSASWMLGHWKDDTVKNGAYVKSLHQYSEKRPEFSALNGIKYSTPVQAEQFFTTFWLADSGLSEADTAKVRLEDALRIYAKGNYPRATACSQWLALTKLGRVEGFSAEVGRTIVAFYPPNRALYIGRLQELRKRAYLAEQMNDLVSHEKWFDQLFREGEEYLAKLTKQDGYVLSTASFELAFTSHMPTRTMLGWKRAEEAAHRVIKLGGSERLTKAARQTVRFLKDVKPRTEKHDLNVIRPPYRNKSSKY